MRWYRRMVLSLSLAVATWVISAPPAEAQQATRPAAKASAPAAKRTAKAPAPPIDPDGTRMEMLLAKWARQSTQLRSLDVKIRRLDKSPKWDDEEYEGRAMFKSPNKAFLDFQKVVTAEGKPRKLVPHERIVCTGTEVWQYRSDTLQVFIHELDLQQRQRALQEGPLPFLFNFEAESARKRYQMKLFSEDEKSYVVTVLPLLPIDKEAFSSAWIQLDKNMLLPTRIILLDPEGKTQKHFVMSEIKPNAQVMAVNFQGVKPKPPWKIMYNKDEGGPGSPGAQAPRTGDARQAPARQAPARRAAVAPGGNVR